MAAFVISIVAMAKKGSKKAIPVTSLIISIVSGIVAIIVSLVTVLAAVSGAASQVADDMSASQDEIQAGIGQPVTTSDGAQLVINSVECGLSSVESSYGSTQTALGQFCVVKFTLSNPSNTPITAFINDFGGLVGETDVEAEAFSLGGFGPDSSSSIELNSGLSVDGVVVIDIPAGSTLDAVTFGGMGRDEVAIAAR